MVCYTKGAEVDHFLVASDVLLSTRRWMLPTKGGLAQLGRLLCWSMQSFALSHCPRLMLAKACGDPKKEKDANKLVEQIAGKQLGGT